MTKVIKAPDPNRKKRYTMLAILIVAIVIFSVLLWFLSEDERIVNFPYFVEGDRVEVTTLFQYSGANPDCGDEMGEDIAALSVTNRSGKHLTYLELVLKLETGEKLVFETTDVPANGTVWMFSTDNMSCASDVVVQSISSTARLEKEDTMLSDKVQTQVEGTAVTLTNVSGEDLTDLTVRCHTLFEEAYFGGLAYSYPVDRLPVGESVTLEAEDCYLGEAAVVRISESR